MPLSLTPLQDVTCRRLRALPRCFYDAATVVYRHDARHYYADMRCFAAMPPFSPCFYAAPATRALLPLLLLPLLIDATLSL